MSNLKQLATIENLGTHAALRKLSEVYRESLESSGTAAPHTTLFLKSGLAMRGQIVSLSEDNEAPSVLLTIHEPNKPEPTDVTYILVDEIAGLSIHGAMAIIEQLSDGKISKPMGPPPSLPDLSRALQSIIDEINRATEGKMSGEISGVSSSAPPDILQALQICIRDLGAVLKNLASRELSRQALREKAFRFKFNVGDEAKIQFDKSDCRISLGLGAGKVERITRESLRVNIEEFL